MANTIKTVTQTSFSSASSATRSLTSVANPSLFVAAVTWDQASRSASVSCSNNGAMTKDAEHKGPTYSNAAVFSVQNTSSSNATITLTITGGTDNGTFCAYEITGAPTSSHVDTSDAQGFNSPGSAQRINLSLTTTTNNCTIIACDARYASAGTTADTGYTNPASEFSGGWNYHIGEYDADVGTAGGNTLSFNNAIPKSRHGSAAVAYKTSAGGTTYNQTVTGSITAAGSVATAALFGAALSGSITTNGGLAKETYKTFMGSVTPSGSVIKDTYKSMSGTISATGGLNKDTTKSFSGSITPEGNLTTAVSFGQLVSGVITATGALITEWFAAKISAGTVARVGVYLRRFMGRR